MFSALVESDELSSIMSTKVETVGPSSLLRDALKRMVKRNIGCLVVVDKRKPVGIVTERDISRQVAKGARALTVQVRRIMSSPLISASPNTRNPQAMEMLLQHRIRRLPVVEGEGLVGIVTERDLMRWVVRITYEPHIPPEIMEILEKPIFSKN
jgi:CBS domain-containing protein